MLERVVVVGASMAGLRAAEAVRKGGWTGELLVIGDERAMPYNRPPLSKGGAVPALDEVAFRMPRAAQDVRWRLGAPVSAADLTARTVTVEGELLGWDGLVVAAGLRPRRLELPGPTAGRHVVRTHSDALALHGALRPGCRVVIVGAGFLGCELAASAVGIGATVDVVAPEAIPIERPLGALLGAEVRRRHETRGVRFHLGVLPESFGGTDRVHSVRLSDGTELAADLVVEAVGCRPNVEWLAGNGLDLSDGVRCDGLLRVEGRPDVVACGDVARFPNARFDGAARRVEHWTMATDTARRAGATLAAHLTGGHLDTAPFAPLPSFWSDQYDLRLQSFGDPAYGAGDVRVLEGELSAQAAVGYHDASGRLVGVVLLGLANRVAHYRAAVATPAVSVPV